jgi:hypothetical protein
MTRFDATNSPKNLLCHRGPCGPDDVELVMGQPQDRRQIREAGIHAGDDCYARPWALPKFRIRCLRIIAVTLYGSVDKAHARLLLGDFV